MSKPEILGQLKAIDNKLDVASSKLVVSNCPTEEVNALCDILSDSQTLLANVIHTIMNHNCACTQEWRDEHTIIAEKVDK